MATKADSGDGSCREVLTGRHQGKWRVQYTSRDELGRTTRLSRLFPNKTEGKDFLKTLRHGAKVEAVERQKELTLSGWFDWLAENDWPEELDEKTVASRLSRFNNYVRKDLGGVPLPKLDPMVVRAFYKELREESVGQPTIIGIRADLVRAFNQAIVPYQRVPMTVANPFRLPLQMAPRRDAVALTPDQAKKALKSKKLDPDRQGILGLLLLSGVRLGEQMAMTREQLLFDLDLISIDRAVRFGKTGQQSIGLPKGDKKRLAVMCPTLKRLLMAISEGLEPGAYLWPAFTENKPRMRKLVYMTWRTILKDAGLPSEMTPHDCRLTHTNWIEKLLPDVSTTTLKEHVGHAAQGVTEAHYTRPITPAQKLLRDGLESLVGFATPT